MVKYKPKKVFNPIFLVFYVKKLILNKKSYLIGGIPEIFKNEKF